MISKEGEELVANSYIVQHTHWDREWYFTTADAKVLSEQVFTEILDELEHNKNVNFCLDGQSSIVDEYVEMHPEKINVIKNLIAKGRLFVGPWYTQTDALLVDAEAMLRNLIIGINDTKKKYGPPMMVGYLPDTFGFNAQIPTLLRHVGIDNFMFWRGIDFNKVSPSPYFKWQGLGNEFVYAINFPFGYMTGLITQEEADNVKSYVQNRLDPALTFLQEHGNNEDILIPSGIDQKNIMQDFGTILNKINDESEFYNKISDYQEFVKVIRKKQDLPKYQGELRKPVYARVHRSIGSVRTRIKTQNYNMEQKIIRQIEPLIVIARKAGVSIGNGLLINLWKKVLENQAHDSIGGCVSDNVAEDIDHRFKEANEIADGIKNLIGKRIANELQLESNQILVFNTDPKPFKGEKILHVLSPSKKITFQDVSHAVIISETYYPARENIMREVTNGQEYFDEPPYYELDVRVGIELPSFGYKVVNFTKSNEPLAGRIEQTLEPTNNVSIANYYGEIQFTNNEIIWKKGSRKIRNFIEITDSANDGDTYDYSPLAGDKEITFTFSDAKKIIDNQKETLEISGTMDLPYDLKDRLSDAPTVGKVNILLSLSLSKTSDIIEGNITVDNQILSHRMRLKINVENNDETSIAQIQNGFAFNKPEPIEENWQQYYVEKPVNLEIFDKSVSVENNDSYISVFADGLKEYERLEDSLYITLMATTGQLGKPDLAWRPGRASGDTTKEGHIMMPTPMAQELGKNHFSFAIRVSKGLFNESETAEISHSRLSPSLSYQLQSLNYFIHRLDNKIWLTKTAIHTNPDESLLHVPNELLVSAVYPSYKDDQAFIVRLANPTVNEVSIDSSLLKQSTIVNAIEEPLTETSVILPYNYVSLKFSLPYL